MKIIAKNDGQRLLFATGDALSKIAKHAGTSRSQAHAWRRGDKVPPEENRAALAEAYGIPVDAWDKPLPNIVVEGRMKSAGRPTKEAAAAREANPPTNHKSADPDIRKKRKVFTQSEDGETIPKPPYPERPDSESATAIDHVQYQLDCIRHDIEHEPLSVAGKSKLRADETRAMTQLEKFKKEQELSEDRYVREHPAWARFTGRILEALIDFPDASKSVMRALQACEE